MIGARVWWRDKSNLEIKLFRRMLYTAFISCVADIIVFVFDGKPGVFIYILLFLGNTWLFVSNVILGSLWMMTVINHITGEGLPDMQKKLVFSLDVIGGVVLLINIFYPIVFKIDSNNVYSRGSLYWLFIVIELIICADSVIVYTVYRKKCPEAKHFPIWQFIVPVLIGLTIQSMIYGISLICPSISIAICGVILGMFSENKEENDILKQNEMKSKIILEQQEKLENALSMAQSASRSKTTFLNNMSHDIRTPMNAIIGYTGLAKKHLDDREKVADYLGKIENSSDYLLSLINEVLDMSRIESGKMTIFEEAENIRNIIDSVDDIIRVDARAKKHDFTISIDGLKDEFVKCDKLRIRQVLVNILSNSIKYTPENGKISMKLTQKPGKTPESATYEFCMSDNGIGMDEEYLAILFEPFTRVKSSTVSGIQGTGLGMAITKNLIDMMGGSIDVKSKPNQGTTITVSFDFKIADGYDIKDADDNADRASNAGLADAEVDYTGKKVLLVEDNELNREIATMILEESGMEVDTASDGDIAVEKMKNAKKGDYDFILMDIQMPRMDGYEATRQIRALESDGERPESDGERITIIAMTANAFDEDRKVAVDAGMDDYLAKPIKTDALLKTLSRYL